MENAWPVDIGLIGGVNGQLMFSAEAQGQSIYDVSESNHTKILAAKIKTKLGVKEAYVQSRRDQIHLNQWCNTYKKL